MLLALPAHAERRVALVIGNGAYQQVSALTNPRADAEEMAAALRRLDFDVELGSGGPVVKTVILDACRENPFATALRQSIGETRAARALSRGIGGAWDGTDAEYAVWTERQREEADRQRQEATEAPGQRPRRNSRRHNRSQ